MKRTNSPAKSKTIKLGSPSPNAKKDQPANEPITLHKLDLIERESHFWIDEIDKCINVETSIKRDINRLAKSGWEVLKIHKYSDGTVQSVDFKAPRNAFGIRKVKNGSDNSELLSMINKPRKEMSAEHKAKLFAGRNKKSEESDSE